MFSTDAMLCCVFVVCNSLMEKEGELNYLLYLFLCVGLEEFVHVACCYVYCIFVTFPCGILGQVWYLIVSFPDLSRLSYLYVLVHVTFVVFVPMSRLFRRTCARDALALLCLCVACWFSACGILGWLRLCIVVLFVFVRVDCWFCCVYVCVLFVWSCFWFGSVYTCVMFFVFFCFLRGILIWLCMCMWFVNLAMPVRVACSVGYVILYCHLGTASRLCRWRFLVIFASFMTLQV